MKFSAAEKELLDALNEGLRPLAKKLKNKDMLISSEDDFINPICEIAITHLLNNFLSTKNDNSYKSGLEQQTRGAMRHKL
jgi:hypothetical protein